MHTYFQIIYQQCIGSCDLSVTKEHDILKTSSSKNVDKSKKLSFPLNFDLLGFIVNKIHNTKNINYYHTKEFNNNLPIIVTQLLIG